MLSGDMRGAAPSFSSDSSRLHVAAKGLDKSTIVHIATQTGKIIAQRAHEDDITGLVMYRKELAVGSLSGISLGAKRIRGGENLTRGCGALLFTSSDGVHAYRDEVIDLPLDRPTLLAANDTFVIGAVGSTFHVYCEEWDHPVEFVHARQITALAAGPGVLAVGDVGGIITAWHVLTRSLPQKKPTFTAKNHWHADQVNALAFWGNSVLSGGEEGVLRVWHLEGQTFQNVPRLGAALCHIVVSDDERWVGVTLRDNSIVLLDSSDWSMKRVLRSLLATTVVPVVTSRNITFGAKNHLTFLDVQRPFQSQTLPLWKRNYIAQEGTPWELVCICFSHDELTLVTCERMDRVAQCRQVMKWWSYNTNSASWVLDSLVYDAHEGRVTAIVSHPTREHFTSVCTQGVIKTWGLEEGQKGLIWQPVWEGCWREEAISAVDISADGSLLVCAYPHRIVLWDPIENAYVHSWKHEGNLCDLRFFQPWGQDLHVCALSSSKLQVWNAMQEGEQVQTISVGGVTLTCSGGRLIVTGSECAVIYRREESLVVEKEIKRGLDHVCIVEGKFTLVKGTCVEMLGRDHQSEEISVTPEEEIIQKKLPIRKEDKRLAIARGTQHCERLDKLFTSPSHLLPPCKLLLQRHIATFAARNSVGELVTETAPDVPTIEWTAQPSVEDYDIGPISDLKLFALCGA